MGFLSEARRILSEGFFLHLVLAHERLQARRKKNVFKNILAGLT